MVEMKDTRDNIFCYPTSFSHCNCLFIWDNGAAFCYLLKDFPEKNPGYWCRDCKIFAGKLVHFLTDGLESWVFMLFSSCSIIDNNTIQEQVGKCFVFTVRLEGIENIWFLSLHCCIITMCTNWNDSWKIWNNASTGFLLRKVLFVLLWRTKRFLLVKLGWCIRMELLRVALWSTFIWTPYSNIFPAECYMNASHPLH